MNSISQFQVTFKVHKKSVEINVSSGRLVPSNGSGSVRGNVTGFSYRSERRMRLALEDTADHWKYFVVLTYPGDFPYDGRKVKRDVEAFKRWVKRQGISDMFWGLEFQKRGAAHINVLLPESVDKDKLSQAWFKIVGSGDERHLRAGTGIEAIRGQQEITSYMIGYLSKRWQKEVPEQYKSVGRFWGCTRAVREVGTYTYRFGSYNAMCSFVKPVADEYSSMMAQWAEERKKEYTWKYRGNSFIMWAGSEFVTKYIIGGSENVSEDSNERVDTTGGRILPGRSDNGVIPEDRSIKVPVKASAVRYRIMRNSYV